MSYDDKFNHIPNLTPVAAFQKIEQLKIWFINERDNYSRADNRAEKSYFAGCVSTLNSVLELLHDLPQTDNSDYNAQQQYPWE